MIRTIHVCDKCGSEQSVGPQEDLKKTDHRTIEIKVSEKGSTYVSSRSPWKKISICKSCQDSMGIPDTDYIEAGEMNSISERLVELLLEIAEENGVMFQE